MTHKQIFPESWNLNQILYGLLVAYVFLLPIHLNLAIGLFLVMVVLNFANILKTGQFWPKVTVPKKISRPLWALFLLSAVSVCWSQEPFLSAYNWIVVVGLKAGSFYFVLRYGSTGRRSLFLVKVFMVSAGLVALYGIYQYFFGVIAIQDAEWIDHAAFPLMTKRAVSTLENPNILASFLVMTAAYSEGLFAPLKGGSDLSSCHYLSDPHVLPRQLDCPILCPLCLCRRFLPQSVPAFHRWGTRGPVDWLGPFVGPHHVHLFHQGYIGRAASDVHGQCDLHD